MDRWSGWSHFGAHYWYWAQTHVSADAFGPIEVANDALWGAQTQRSLMNFPIGWEKQPVAIVRAGLATAAEVCGHVSQVWCARVPIGATYSSSNAHPAPNERGDKLCATLEALGYSV